MSGRPLSEWRRGAGGRWRPTLLGSFLLRLLLAMAALGGCTAAAPELQPQGQLAGLGSKTPEELRDCYDLDIAFTSDYDI